MSPITTDLRRTAGVETQHSPDDYDLSALWEVWEEHYVPTRRRLARRTGRPVSDHEVHDAVTDALLRLHRALTDGTVDGDVPGWLATVAWREFLRRTGREKGRARLEKTAFARTERIERNLGPEDVALEHAGRRAQRRALDLGLQTITPGQRAAFEMFAEGASYEQIAAARTTTLRATERAVLRARRQLRLSGLIAREAREWAR
jgi:RNA polymerase sigma factor (sigma-70 family)